MQYQTSVPANTPGSVPGNVVIQREPEQVVTTQNVNATNVLPEVTIYDRTSLLYWWPVWFVGLFLAILTMSLGKDVAIGDSTARFHSSNELGVVFIATVAIVLTVTNFSVRGSASLAVIATIAAIVIFFAYMGWWTHILRMLGNLDIYMNAGFYFVISTVLFAIWAIGFFFTSQLTSFQFRPGQMEHRTFLGGGTKSFDGNSITVDKLQDDMFRHWILGFGTGDIKITSSVNNAEFIVRNVPFASHVVQQIQRLVAMKPSGEILNQTIVRPVVDSN